MIAIVIYSTSKKHTSRIYRMSVYVNISLLANTHTHTRAAHKYDLVDKRIAYDYVYMGRVKKTLWQTPK